MEISFNRLRKCGAIEHLYHRSEGIFLQLVVLSTYFVDFADIMFVTSIKRYAFSCIFNRFVCGNDDHSQHVCHRSESTSYTICFNMVCFSTVLIIMKTSCLWPSSNVRLFHANFIYSVEEKMCYRTSLPQQRMNVFPDFLRLGVLSTGFIIWQTSWLLSVSNVMIFLAGLIDSFPGMTC